MSPEKAIQLVQRYAAANRRIKEQTHIIGIHLANCHGRDGRRLDENAPVALDAKNRDKRTHLWKWYQPEIEEYGARSYQDISAEEHGEECPHCYMAHLAVEERKAARKELGIVRRLIGREGGAA